MKMVSFKENYEVIIVGGDHHNGLGLARIFGINKVKVHSFVISENSKSFLAKSKYIYDCHICANERQAFDTIVSIFGSVREKFFIIPYSDAAALELDLRLYELKGFMTPSIKGKQGLIAELMDKSNQYQFAKENGIKMAQTITYYFDQKNAKLSMKYPCIVKPVISAEGDKRDIAICNSENQLLSVLEKLREKHYKRVLIQEYLTIDYEIDVFGCVLKQKPFFCQIPTKTIRSWPVKGGTNSYSEILVETDIIKKCSAIIDSLRKLGFYGLYDIELFVVGKDVVLNEINFRNSGDVYMGISQNYYYPYAWTEDYMGEKINIYTNPQQSVFAMTECADIRNVIVRNVSFFSWLKDYHVCKDYALRFKGDNKPAVCRYFYYFKQMMKGKRL